jgi:hypothetical protein
VKKAEKGKGRDLQTLIKLLLVFEISVGVSASGSQQDITLTKPSTVQCTAHGLDTVHTSNPLVQVRSKYGPATIQIPRSTIQLGPNRMVQRTGLGPYGSDQAGPCFQCVQSSANSENVPPENHTLSSPIPHSDLCRIICAQAVESLLNKHEGIGQAGVRPLISQALKSMEVQLQFTCWSC